MDIQEIDRKACKIVTENGGRHPCVSNAILYLLQDEGGRGLRLVKMEYKATEIKSEVRLYGNHNPACKRCGSLKSKQRKWDGGLWLKSRLGS